MDLELQKLAQAIQIDLDYLPKYVDLYQRSYGKLPDLGPLLTATCQLHPNCHYLRQYRSLESGPGVYPDPEIQESHLWEFHPKWHLTSELLNWMGISENLFSVKKRLLPQSVSSEQLLETFYREISHFLGIQLCWSVIKDFFENKLQYVIPIIAELNIPTRVSNYPLIPISLEEAIELVNLRVDLIKHGHSPWVPREPAWLALNSLGYCLENHSPDTIFSFSAIGGMENLRTSEPPYLYLTNFRCGITFHHYNMSLDSYGSPNQIRAEFSVFG